jgi:hypothetical protein
MNSKWNEVSLQKDVKTYSADFLLPAAGYRGQSNKKVDDQ